MTDVTQWEPEPEPEDEPLDEETFVNALAALTRTIEFAEELPTIQRAKLMSRIYRALKVMTDDVQSRRADALFDMALGIAEIRRVQENKIMTDFPGSQWHGDFLDEDPIYEKKSDGTKWKIPEASRHFEKAKIDMQFKLGTDHFFLPNKKPGERERMYDTFSNEYEPFKIAERERERRVERRKVREHREEMRAERERQREAKRKDTP